jgi:hypothetical protein
MCRVGSHPGVGLESAGDLERAIPLYEANLADVERVTGRHPLTAQNDPLKTLKPQLATTG